MFFSITGQATAAGGLYDGDMVPGDREATVEEIVAWELSRAPAPPTPIEEIRAIESAPAVKDAATRAARIAALEYALDRVVRKQAERVPPVVITREQAHAWSFANDTDYRTLFNAEMAIKPIRALIP